MTAEPGASTLLLINLARTDDERVAMEQIFLRYPGAVVISAYERGEDGALNVNQAFGADGFWSSQVDLASRLDEHLDQCKIVRPEQGSLIDGLRTQLFEHNLHELHKWIFSLETWLRGKDTSRLEVMFPEARSSDEIALFEAEGEVSTGGFTRLLYRRTDFLLHHIRAFFAAKGIRTTSGYRIGQRDWLGPVGRRVFRSYGLLAFKFAKHVKHRLRHRATDRSDPARCPPVVVLTRSVVHSDYLAKLVRSGAATPMVMDSALQYPNLWQASNAMFGRTSVHLYDLVSLRAIFAQFLKSLRDLLRSDLGLWPMPAKFEFHGIEISLGSCIREAIAVRFENALLCQGVGSYLKSRPEVQALVHCEMFTSYAAYLARVADDVGVGCYQAAFGTYEMRPITRSVHGDGFLCFSKHQEESLRAVQKNDRRISYQGNLYIDDSAGADAPADNAAARARARHLVFYAQPYDESSENAMLSRLSEIAVAHGYRLSVVLHPRGRLTGPLPAGTVARIIENSEYIENREAIEQDITFAITRTSNVGYQLILRDVPVINVISSPGDRIVKQEYFEGYPLILLSVDHLGNFLAEPQSKILDFARFRKKFVGDAYQELGYRHVSDFLDRPA